MNLIGLQSGMVMQRDRHDRSDITLHSDTPLTDATYRGNTSGRLTLTPLTDGNYRLQGIPVGGPYTVCLNGTEFSDVYVGDNWLLAGQSNMAGVGHTTPRDCADLGEPSVRAFYMTDHWDTANHPLHETGRAVDKVHTAVIGAGATNYEACVGPGLAFARRLRELTGVPQGLICCAHSGTSMWQWSEELAHLGGDGSLYGAMLRRFRVCGSHVRGLFWYQGCNETGADTHTVFTERMTSFFAACRRDFGTDLPIVQVQIGRVTNRTVPLEEDFWDSVQEQQRTMDQKIRNLSTLSVLSLPLDDAIHLSSDSQRHLGTEAGEAMYCLLYPDAPQGCLPPPAVESITLEPGPFNRWAMVRIRYRNLHGSLTAIGRPSGFSIIEAEGQSPFQHVHDIRIHENEVLLLCDRMPEDVLGGRLYYGKGANPYANITDEKGRDLPAMGPIPILSITENGMSYGSHPIESCYST